MFEIEGLKMISKARKYRRGGGVCIIADITQVCITPLEVDTGNLEVVWAIVKPLQESCIKEIITFTFYLPPKSRMKSKMTDHIVTTLHQLLTTYPRAGIMGGGDRTCPLFWLLSPTFKTYNSRPLSIERIWTCSSQTLVHSTLLPSLSLRCSLTIQPRGREGTIACL